MNLTSFQQSVFLQSLGWAIANSIWQGGILWIFYQVVVTSYNNASAKIKNNLSTALLFGNFLWFVITFCTKMVHLHDLPAAALNHPGDTAAAGAITVDLGLTNVISAIAFTFPYLSVAYLLLLLFFAIKLVNAYRNTSFMKNSGLSRPGAEWKTFVDKVTHHITLNKNIKIWFSKYVDVPATIGFLKPVILIPLASLNQLTANQMEAIILHEISHIKRNDYLINLFVSLIETVLFFNPFVVLLARIIKKERENCCDDFVLQYQYDRHSYATALLVLERSREQQFHLALAATSGHHQLLVRIKRIMETKNNNDGLNYGQKLLALLIGTGIIFSIAWLTPEKKANQHFVQNLPAVRLLKNAPENSAITRDRNTSKMKGDEGKANAPVTESKAVNDKPGNSNVPETVGTSADEVSLPAVDEQSNEDKSLIKSPDDKTVMAADPNPSINLSGDTNDDSNLTDDSFSSISSILNELHLNIDLKEIKSEIEKKNSALSSVDWADLSTQVNQGLKKIRFPAFKVNIQNNDKVNLALAQINQKQCELQKLKQLSDAQYMRRMMSRRNMDSLRFAYRNEDANAYNKEYIANDREYTENNTLPPPPPASLKRKRQLFVYQAPAYPHPVTSFAYSFQSDNNSPVAKAKRHSPEAVRYKKGSIIINGQEIKLPGINKSQLQKIVSIVLDNDKNLTEISSRD